MAARLGRQEARTVIDAMLQAAIDRKLEFAAAVVDPGAQEVLPGGSAAPAPVSVPDTAAAPATKKRRFDPPKIVWIGLAGSALVIGIIVGVLSR